MKKYGRDNRPYIRPVKRVELSETNVKIRMIAIVVLLAIAVTAIGTGLMSVLKTEPGWQLVQANSQKANCGSDFVLQYDFSLDGGDASAKYRQLEILYSQAVEEAFLIFSADVEDAACANAAFLNAHLNEIVTVHEALYEALSLVVQYNDRHVFTAPAAVEYNRVFLSEGDAEAMQYDPAHNAETARWLQDLAIFVSDEGHIGLDILDNNQVRLNVSEEYLAFGEEYGIEIYLDFGWMTNAFRADYLADALKDAGFTNGYLASYDGFTRNLDTRGNSYSVNLFARNGNDINLPAQLDYNRPVSIVALRDYPMTQEDRWHYYGYENGDIVTAFVDPVDCRSKCAISDLVCYSYDLGCAEVLMQSAKTFTADAFLEENLAQLTQEGIWSIWSQGLTLMYNEKEAAVTALQNNGDAYSIINVS